MLKNYNNNDYNNKTTIIKTKMEFSIDKISLNIKSFVDNLSDDYFVSGLPSGRPAFSRKNLLKLWLYGYCHSVFSGRKLSKMASDNFNMRWLINADNIVDVPSYRTINRFRTESNTNNILKYIYKEFRENLLKNKLIDNQAIFIDGTKMLANANKYSFVWKKSTINFHDRLNQKILNMYNNLANENINLNINDIRPNHFKEDIVKLSNLSRCKKALEQIIEQLAVNKNSKGKPKYKQCLKHLKSYLKIIIKDYIPRKRKYLRYMEIFGNRNSFSKTDHDATFMKMKEDPMLNGQVKPGYNLQIATQSQFVLDYYVNQRPADTRTLIPFLNKMNINETSFHYIVADAGYGSEYNYQFIYDNNKVPLVPYALYRRDQSKKHKMDPYNWKNWKYNINDDIFTDYYDVEFVHIDSEIIIDKNGNEKFYKYYRARNYSDSEKYQYSITQDGKKRTLNINLTWEYYKNIIQNNLATDVGKSIYAKRKLEVESVFGNLKKNIGYNKLYVRGITAANNELGLILMAMNLKKLSFFIFIIFDTKKACTILNLNMLFLKNKTFVPAPPTIYPSIIVVI